MDNAGPDGAIVWNIIGSCNQVLPEAKSHEMCTVLLDQ